MFDVCAPSCGRRKVSKETRRAVFSKKKKMDGGGGLWIDVPTKDSSNKWRAESKGEREKQKCVILFGWIRNVLWEREKLWSARSAAWRETHSRCANLERHHSDNRFVAHSRPSRCVCVCTVGAQCVVCFRIIRRKGEKDWRWRRKGKRIVTYESFPRNWPISLSGFRRCHSNGGQGGPRRKSAQLLLNWFEFLFDCCR